MVFGNLRRRLGHGRGVHARPEHGRERALRRVPHERAGRGRRRGHPHGARRSRSSSARCPKCTRSSCGSRGRLERHYRDVQDLEFTIERGRLYMLQTRAAKRTAAAAVRIAVDLANEGIITQRRGGHARDAGADRAAAARSVRREGARRGAAAREGPERVARRGGRAARCSTPTTRSRGPRAASASCSCASRRRPTTSTAWPSPKAIFTARGGATSHAAVVARQIGKPCVAGCAELVVDARGEARALDRDWSRDRRRRLAQRRRQHAARCSSAQSPTVSARFEDQPALHTLLSWADEVRRLEIWANADKPEEAAQARRYGAQGIGLCRTEHMFREGDRLPIVRRAILAAPLAMRAKAARAAGQRSDAARKPSHARRSTAALASSSGCSRAISRACSTRWTVCRS